jgi:hypothetical protein
VIFSNENINFVFRLKKNEFADMYKRVKFRFSSAWYIERNEFYDIDPEDNVDELDKYWNIYVQEDLLAMKNGNILLDLGWYGGEFSNESAGCCIHLIRGKSWSDGELLEKFYSRNKEVIKDKVNELIDAVDNGEYESLKGFRVDENDPDNMNCFSKLDSYSARLSSGS